VLARLPDRLRAYRKWPPGDWRIVVLVDRDDEDCRRLKAKLKEMAAAAGLFPRLAAAGRSCAVVNRITVEELEARYFGDWEAVRRAHPRAFRTVPAPVPYRHSDSIGRSTWEAFERVLQDAGYFRTGLGKIEAARAIGPHPDPDRNTSPSFRVFGEALREMEP